MVGMAGSILTIVLPENKENNRFKNNDVIAGKNRGNDVSGLTRQIRHNCVAHPSNLGKICPIPKAYS